MIVKKITYILFLLLSVVMTSNAQIVQVEQKIDSIQMLIGEQTAFTLTVTSPPGKKVEMPDFGSPIVPGTLLQKDNPYVEVVELIGSDTTTLDDGFQRIKHIYSITSFEPGVHAINPITIKVGGREYMGNKLALKILDMDVDTTKMDQMFPPKTIHKNEFMFSEWLPVIVGFMIASILAGLAFWLYYRVKQQRPIVIRFRTVKHVPAHERAIEEIAALKADKLTIENDQKGYYTRLTDSLRRYMEERFGFSAMEMTSAEIIERLKQEDSDKIEELKSLFETADLVKFAKYSALMNENDRNLVSAVDFINLTKTDETTTIVKEQEQQTEEERNMHRTQELFRFVAVIAAIAVVVIATLALWRVYNLIE